MGTTVLIVDDDAAILEMLAELFEEEGYRVCRARDGETALAKVRDHPPDLVLADVVLPGSNGQQLAAEAIARKLPIILMSAGARECPIDGVKFIAKPFDLEHLLSVVANVVGTPA